MKFFSLITLAVASASAASLNGRSAQDVFVPTITSPTVKTVWKVGTSQTITWNTSNAPIQITNKFGQVMLAKGGVATPIVLAAGFNITDGKVNIIVPNAINGTDYSIQLFGDSGNFSPAFKITGSNSFF